MNKKSLIIITLLVFIVILSVSSVSAEDATLKGNNNVIGTIQADEISTPITETVTVGSSSADIQEKINGLNDGDILNFEAGEYKDICIYVNKSITINGNGAILTGYDTPSKDNTPEIIWKPTNESGYAIGNFATLYVVKATGVTINGLSIVGGTNSAKTYSNTLVYAMNANNLTFNGNILDGSSWGLYLQYCNDGIIDGNIIKNQAVTGILNFGSARTVIENNKITNAKNHGIDVRHGSGPNVQVINNTVIGSKEGIYLMHSKGHTATENTLINCTISSISCYGSSNINLYGNTMKKSRIGVLLGGGYSNITIGENNFKLDNLPYPPTFVYYVAEAKSEYQSAANIMGTYSDMSSYSPNYVEYTKIDTPAEINIDYDSILEKTGTIWTVPEGTSSSDIQKMIDGMSDGDSLIFSNNAVYYDISIYTDKNIKIFGNNATLIGYNNIDINNIPEKIRKSTNESGYAIAYRAVLYVVNTTGVVVSDLNIIAQYPGYDTTNATTTTDEYKSAGIYADTNKNLVITGCDVTGASWGIFEQYSSDSIISRNNVHDVYTTGIMNFGSPRAIIVENTVTNAVNHGIDTRHGTGPDVTIAFNTIAGAKEGIYLMHSKGHTVYNNTVKDCKISGITAYGSGNEVIFNNTITGSRIGFLLGGGYYNVTIGENKYTLDSLPFPPTFVTYLARADSKYQSASDVMRTYYDKEPVNMDVPKTITTVYIGSEVNITVLDQYGKPIANQEVSVVAGEVTTGATTDKNGVATIVGFDYGTFNATFTFEGSDNYAKTTTTATLIVLDNRAEPVLTANGKTYYLQAISKGSAYTVIVKDKSGKALPTEDIEIIYAGKTYKATTNDEGVATVTLKATATGTKTATVKVIENLAVKGTSKTVIIKVTKEPTKITAAKKTFKVSTKNKKYTVTLKSKSNKAISKAKVTLKVNGKIYKATTNAKGKSTFNINKLTKVGTFKAVIKYAGNKYYSASSKNVKITTKR